MKILAIITVIFTFIFMLVNRQASFIFNLSNCFFCIGLIYLCIAFLIYVRNSGFFKVVSYFKYKINKKKIKGYELPDEKIGEDPTKPMSFYDFFETKYSHKWSNAIFYKFSIPLLVMSFILAMLVKHN